MILTPVSSSMQPATTAAATSPIEWPMTAAGRSPCARHSSASATWTPKITGWATHGESRTASGSSWARSERSPCSRISGSRRSIAAAKAGSASSSRRAMPGHCDP
jgi:hypothetical protein